MAFDVMKFFVNALVIERQGVDQDRSRQLAVLPSFLGSSFVESIVLSTLLARREAESSETLDTRQVPAVVGKSRRDAELALKEAEFVPVVQEKEDSKRVGLVLSQSPAPCTYAAVGSTVTIVVGTDVVVKASGNTPQRSVGGRKAAAG